MNTVSSIGGSQILGKIIKSNGENKIDFIKFFKEALGKTNNDHGWENREKIIEEKEFNQHDLNKDKIIDAKDMKELFPDKKADIEKIETNLGKTHENPNWEDLVNTIRGDKHGDLNKDGRINGRDLYILRQYLRQNSGQYDPFYDVNGDKKVDWNDLRWLIRRFGTTASSPQWEDKIIVLKEGAKHSDKNQDKKIDHEDIKFLIPDPKVKEAYGKTNNDHDWEDKVIKEIIPGYKNVDLNNDNKITESDLSLYFKEKYQNGTVAKQGDTFFFIFEGEKRKIGDYNELLSKGIVNPKITLIPEEELSLIPEGKPLVIITESQTPDFIKSALGKTKDSPDWEDISYFKMGAKNADFNGDGKVNRHDFIIFMNAYRRNYDPKVDLNADGKINLEDFKIFRSHYFKTSSSPDWEDQKITIPKTGYKNLDINNDNKISTLAKT